MWKEFRQSLDITNTYEVCETVLNWWESAPLINISIDPVNADQWPTPWEMLHQGDFCESSLALGMSYTIYYANPKIRNELIFVTCRDKGLQKLCALIDNQYLLNFERSSISTFPQDSCEISYRVLINDIINK